MRLKLMASIFDYSIVGIPLVPIIIVAVIGFLLIKIFKMRKKDEIEAPDIDVKKETTKELDRLIKNHGWKKGKFNKLRVGINPIGVMIAYAIEYHNVKKEVKKDEIIEQKAEDLTLTLDNIYYILRVRKFGFISALLSLLNIGIERYIIDATMIDNLNKDSFKIDSDLILNFSTT